MTRRRRFLALALAFTTPGCAIDAMTAAEPAESKRRGRARAGPIVIAHRGASGYRPEHTLAAYELAIQQGADFIEPDLVVTRDGVLIARHENEISGTTDVAARPEFASRRNSRTIDGVPISGWFAEDFTLAEIKTLRARERIPQLRADNARFDGQFEVPTLAEIVALVERYGRKGRVVGIYPETKHPTWFAREGKYLDGSPIGRSLGGMLVDELVRLGFTDPGRVYIQSFEFANLIELKLRIMPAAGVDLPLIQLYGDVDGTGGVASFPYDMHYHAMRGDDLGAIYGGLATRVTGGIGASTGYSGLSSRPVLDYIAGTHATGIGPWKNNLYAPSAPDAARPILANALSAGLRVHPYTLRVEEPFLGVRDDGSRLAATDEALLLLRLGVHGFFIDQPDVGVAARDRFLASADAMRNT